MHVFISGIALVNIFEQLKICLVTPPTQLCIECADIFYRLHANEKWLKMAKISYVGYN